MGMAMARGFWLVAVAASCFCICLKPPLWEATPTHPSPSPMALNVHGIMCSALFLPLTPCRLSLFVCICVSSTHVATPFLVLRCPGRSILARVSWARTQELAIPIDLFPPVLLPVSGCWSLVAADNNNSGELRAGWEMPLICWSCQLSRSEMKWKSHALMAEMLSPGGRGLPVGPPNTHSCPKKKSSWPRCFTLVNGGFLFLFFKRLVLNIRTLP